jgi:hypothetical protein
MMVLEKRRCEPDGAGLGAKHQQEDGVAARIDRAG